MARIKSRARVRGALTVKLRTILLIAFAIGTFAGVSSGGGQGPFATAPLSGGLIQSAHAQNKPGAMNSLPARTEWIVPPWRVMNVRGQAEVRKGGRLWHQWSSVSAGDPLEPRAQLRRAPLR